MKGFKYFVIPVVIANSLFNSVYAEIPSYMEPAALSFAENGFYTFFKTIYYILMFALILAAAYYVTKFLAKKGIAQNKSRNMKVIESMPLGPDKRLNLVKVGSQYFLIGSTVRNMFMISEVDPEKLFEEQAEDAEIMDNFDYDSIDDSFEVKDFGTQLNAVKKNLYKLKSMIRGSNKDEK